MSPAQPARLGRYEIVSALARGGMAELYLARLPGIEGFAKRVVIKRVLPELARDREFVDMLLAEARLAAQLDHQNIVHVTDIGHDAGGYFFAMELLHGADVASILRAAIARDGGLPLGIALEIARGACAGLHYAHERVGPDGAPLGLVHRDVSPQNLFVTFDGAVKLLDFGIARAVEKIANHYTRSGTLRGKVPYMSPEQCQAEPLDRRSDVFSLAIVLWEMTVGERLFGGGGESDFAVLKAIVEHDAPAPSTRKPGYPPALETIVLNGLRRARAERYPTADALHAALDGFIRAHGLWTSARDLAGYMAELFPDRAAAWAREADAGAAGAHGRHTVELPATPVTRATPDDAIRVVAAPAASAATARDDGAPARAPSGRGHSARVASMPSLDGGAGSAGAGAGTVQAASSGRGAAGDAHAASAPSDVAGEHPPRGPGAGAPASIADGRAVATAAPPRSRAPWIAAAIGGIGLALVAGYVVGRGGREDAGREAHGATTAAATPPRPGSADAPSAAPDAPASPPAVPAPGPEDAHFLRADDYLVHARPFRDGRLDGVRVAKLLGAPPAAGDRARFLDGKGVELATEAYWRTRIATPADLALGRFAFCRVDPYVREAHRPKDRDEARTRTWTLARITDVADVGAGRVMVGPVACDVDGVRVPVE